MRRDTFCATARVPVTEFRAGMIVGSGSALFEMIRYLTEREPVLVCPAWFFSEAQPIAIRDVLSYLIEALKTPESAGRMIEIGGPTRLTYADMLLGYAKERGLKRKLIRTPFYAPRLSAYWVHMVTPIHWRVVLPLIEGLRARLIVRDGAAKKLFPQIKPIDFHTAVHLALGRIQRDNVETSWSDALVTVAGMSSPINLSWKKACTWRRASSFSIFLPRMCSARTPASAASAAGCTWIGRGPCAAGWTKPSAVWACGAVAVIPMISAPASRLISGAWRKWKRDRLLRLRAEMKLPGKAWLQFESEPQRWERRSSP